MILAVTTAMGPWVYNQSDREKLVQASAILLTLSSICGMFFYIFFFSQNDNFTDSNYLSAIAMLSWKVLLSVAFLNMLLMLLISSRHTLFFSHLTMKPQKTKTGQMKKRPWRPRRIEYSSPDIRTDAPRGRYLQNEYAQFVRSIWQMEEHYGIKNRNDYSEQPLVDIQYSSDNKTKWSCEKILQVFLSIILLVLVSCYLFGMLPSFKDGYYFGFWIQSTIIITLFIAVAFYFLSKSLSSQDNNEAMKDNEAIDNELPFADDEAFDGCAMQTMLHEADDISKKK